MEINWSILGWIAGLIFIYIFGIFEGRGQGYKKRKAEQEQEKIAQPAPAQPTTLNVDDPGVLRIKIENGSPTLDLDGTRVNPASLSSIQSKRLIDLISMIRPGLEAETASAPSMTTLPPLSKRISVSVQPAIPTPPPNPVFNAIAKALTIAKEDRPATAANSIVGQIDAVLQTRLIGTPLEERGVFLAQTPEGGVIVYVGLSKYLGIDEVPDEEIKAAIRAAIAEWENKSTPGL